MEKVRSVCHFKLKHALMCCLSIIEEHLYTPIRWCGNVLSQDEWGSQLKWELMMAKSVVNKLEAWHILGWAERQSRCWRSSYQHLLRAKSFPSPSKPTSVLWRLVSCCFSIALLWWRISNTLPHLSSSPSIIQFQINCQLPLSTVWSIFLGRRKIRW